MEFLKLHSIIISKRNRMLNIFKEGTKQFPTKELQTKIDNLDTTLEILSNTLTQKSQKTIELVFLLRGVINECPELKSKINNLEGLNGFISQCLLKVEEKVKDVQMFLKKHKN